ncbi:DNA-3-methyladenine glycosylase family protein [Laceyella putida]|uniref:DNA-3-methyladenine glycosylase II n=1 Tax=Laceyella putida TaxID=110101 RepID=A0ABW2RIB7_9BACL
MEFFLPLNYPYSFEKTIKRLRTFEKSSFAAAGERLSRTIHGKRGPLLCTIGPVKGEKALHVKIEGSLAEGEQETLKQTLSRMFSTAVDLTPFYEQMGRDPVLAPVIAAREGMHFVLEPSLYECLIKTIIGQQLNVSFAATLIRRFQERAGGKVSFHGREWPLFPTAEQAARLEYEDLQALQFNRRKAEYVIDLSRLVANGELDLDSLWELNDEEVLRMLLPIRGIGRWTVECVLLFGLGRPDLLPAADIGLRNALKRVYRLDHQPSEAEVRKLGEEWAPYRSYVTFYLWDTLDNMKSG